MDVEANTRGAQRLPDAAARETSLIEQGGYAALAGLVIIAIAMALL